MGANHHIRYKPVSTIATAFACAWLLISMPACARLGAGQFLAPFLNSDSLNALVSLSIQGSTTLEVGTPVRFSATGTNVGGGMFEATSLADWSSDNSTIAAANNDPGNRGTITPANAGTTTIRVSLNGVTAEFAVTVTADTLGPEVNIASALNNTTARIIFSETVDAATAGAVANFRFADGNGTGTCSDNSNFTGSAATGDFTITQATCLNNYCDLTLSAAPIAAKQYTIFANKTIIKDASGPGNTLGCPNSATFIGQEQLKAAAATCATTTDVVITFSKPVRTGVNADRSAECTGNAQCALRYKLTGAAAVGDIQSVAALNGVNCGGQSADASGTRFCLTHQNNQSGGLYSLVLANNLDGDGFDNLGCGWGISCAIRDVADTENVQMLNNDRVSFTGCGTSPDSLASGPLSSDTFGDSTAFGYLTGYNGKIYIGPNQAGNAVTRFNVDISNPFMHSFEFTQDLSFANGSTSHTNAAGTRDGGIAVPPYVTLGHTGCTVGNADLATGCGPHNENGRGLFTTGTISGVEHLFLLGVRTGGNNDYLYYTTDTDGVLNFNFVDFQAPLDMGDVNINTGNRGFDSLVTFGDRVYFVQPGDRQFRPYFVKLNNLNPQSQNNVDSVWMTIRFMTGFGRYSATRPAHADRMGATLHVFNNRLYLANSGSVRDNTNGDYDCPEGNTSATNPSCISDGGIIRTTNTNPGRCTAADTCPDFVDISPTTAEYRNYFSKILEGVTDLTPAQRPIPAFAEFSGNLYMIRNACTTNMINRGCDASDCTDDGAPANRSCPAGNEVPQLWKCTPGVDGHCDAGDWAMIAQNGVTGRTNFADGDNRFVSMLVVNGPYLYVGFDNANGIQVWRTKAGTTDPAVASDFEQIGGSGLGDAVNNLQIYSTTSVVQAPDYHLFISAGRNATPVKIYRQKDN